jgi:type III secretion system needle length determinant
MAGRSGKDGAAAGKELWPFDGTREQGKAGRPNTSDVLAKRDSSLPSGDSILAALHEGRPDQAQQAQQAGGPNLAAASQVETASRPGESLAAQLAERILVSAPDAAGGREVRILLREDVLPGTEIRIQRQEGGALSVSFVTNDLRAEQILGGGALSDLHNALAGKLQVEVQVRIVRPDGGLTAEAGGQSDSRQSGDGQGGSRDGRDGRHEGRSRQHDLFTGLRDEG